MLSRPTIGSSALALCIGLACLNVAHGQHGGSDPIEPGSNEMALLLGHTHMSHRPSLQGDTRWLVLPGYFLKHGRSIGGK